MSFISGKFYRYRKAYKGVLRTDLRAGDVYCFKAERDLYPTLQKDFLMTNAMGEIFEMSCSYQALDDYRIEDSFEEVPKPSWWDNPAPPIEG